MDPAIRVTFGNASRRRGERGSRVISADIPVAKGDNLVTFDFLVSAEADVIATLLRRCRRAVTVDHRSVKKVRMMKGQHRAGEDCLKTTIRLPSSKRTIDASVVNFPASGFVPFDGQFLPLASQVKQLQDVIVEGVQ